MRASASVPSDHRSDDEPAAPLTDVVHRAGHENDGAPGDPGDDPLGRGATRDSGADNDAIAVVDTSPSSGTGPPKDREALFR